MEKLKRRQRCTRCQELKPDVHKRLDPYEADLNGVEIWVVICDACEKDLADEL